jgi:hypothetical protein
MQRRLQEDHNKTQCSTFTQGCSDEREDQRSETAQAEQPDVRRVTPTFDTSSSTSSCRRLNWAMSTSCCRPAPKSFDICETEAVRRVWGRRQGNTVTPFYLGHSDASGRLKPHCDGCKHPASRPCTSRTSRRHAKGSPTPQRGERDTVRLCGNGPPSRT